jgi:hypothetical protein
MSDVHNHIDIDTSVLLVHLQIGVSDGLNFGALDMLGQGELLSSSLGLHPKFFLI